MIIVKQGIIQGQFFGHKGLLEINVHIIAGVFLFLAGLLVASLLWRKFYYVKQGWFAIRSGIALIGFIGLGEAAEHFFGGAGYDFFHYLHLLSAPFAMLFLYAALVELEALYFKLEGREVISVKGIYGIISVTILLAALLGLNVDYGFQKASLEMLFLLITTLPTLFFAVILIFKSVDLYRKQHQLSIYSLSIFSTILSLMPLLAISVALLSVDILVGRFADRLVLPLTYLVSHSILDALIAFTGSILIGSSVMMLMSPDLSSLQERIVQSAKYVALGEMAANITYQLENPLNKIKVLSELLLSDHDDVNYREDLRKINQEADKVIEIAGGLLDYSHSSSPHYQVTSLKGLLDDALNLLRPRFRHSGIRVTKKLQRPLPYISADRNQLKQAFVDILNNAADVLGGGGVIKISAFARDDKIKIVFHDNGPGIERENLEKIFEPFYTTKKEGRGTGLGLAFAWSVVRSHQGLIKAESRGPGQGTDIIIQLPVLKDNLVKQHLTDKKILVQKPSV